MNMAKEPKQLRTTHFDSKLLLPTKPQTQTTYSSKKFPPFRTYRLSVTEGALNAIAVPATEDRLDNPFSPFLVSRALLYLLALGGALPRHRVANDERLPVD